jgi:capsular polysaccharide export protein
MKLVGLASPALLAIPDLAVFLEPWGQPVALRRGGSPGGDLAALAGPPKGAAAARLCAAAQRRGLPYLRLAEGFLSPGGGAGPWSLIVDDLGIYFDTDAPSRLETLIDAVPSASAETAELLSRVRETFPAPERPLSGAETPFVLLIDQTLDDPALPADAAACFARMVEAAMSEHPKARLAILRPDRRGAGALQSFGRRHRLPFLESRFPWLSSQGRVLEVYTVSSLAGWSAMVAGLPVTCFGRPFYAGRGLTRDRAGAPPRAPRSLEALAHAVYALYPRYVDPVHHRASDAISVAGRLAALSRRAASEACPAIVLGVSRWKQPFVRPFLSSGDNRIRFARRIGPALAAAAREEARLLVWAAKEPPWLPAAAAAAGVPLARIEDGFLRSVGLGSDFIPALSLVVDDLGIYFDPNRESRLERLISEAAFSAALLDSAAEMRRVLSERRHSKYGVGTPPPRIPDLPPGRRRILVPGQVEDDASIRLGAFDVATNAALLRAVRRAAPDAVILYKPHPDVESGNRRGAVAPAILSEAADAVLSGWDAPSALDLADEVHTMTSLLGFEALLRGRPVTTYGLPFYAGLGLTSDRLPWPRPRAPVSLDRLVAAVLLLYPRYRDPATDLPVTAWDVLELLERARSRPGAARSARGRVRRWIALTLGRG